MAVNIEPRIIIALDFDNVTQAYDLVSLLTPDRCRLKVGLQMFVHFGPDFVEALVEKGFEVFLDLKLHDIPTTVAKACTAAAALGVWMISVHALGGQSMLLAAKEALDKLDYRPYLIGVTLLTSLGVSDLAAMGLGGSTLSNVEHLALLVKNAGLDGIVCSAQEAQLLRPLVGSDFYLITPGIRLPGDSADDQKRIMTPDTAIASGADFLVVGRSITHAPDPLFALARIESLVTDALNREI